MATSGASWAAFLAGRSGVRAAEMFWTGLDDFLALRSTARVTQAEIQTFLAENKVQIAEVVKRAPPATELGDWDTAAQRNTKYSTYVLPGGQNYRELLMTLPRRIEPMVFPEPLVALPAGYEPIVDQSQRPDRRWGVTPPGQLHARPWAGRHPTREDALDAALRQLNEQRNVQAADAWRERNEGKSFRGGHFDEANVIVHVRFNERSDATGKRVLFIEEVQSDWAQKGRRKGFTASTRDEEKELAAANARHNEIQDRFDQRPTDPREREALANEERELARLINELHLRIEAGRQGVPAAPFVEETHAWCTLAMKRMIRWAAEDGFDKIAWTTGNHQIDRYDLSKQIDSVVVVEWPAAGKDHVLLVARKDGADLIKETVPAQRLPDFIGKDAADKIMSQAKDPLTGMRSLSGVDLRVGGEGMRTFYDKILPSVAGKLGKSFGSQVSETQLCTVDPEAVFEGERPDEWWIRTDDGYDVDGPYATREEALQVAGIDEGLSRVHSLEIPAEMRRSVIEHGQPLFSVARWSRTAGDLGERTARVFPGLPLERVDGSVVLSTPSGRRIVVTSRDRLEVSEEAVRERHGSARVEALSRGESQLVGATIVGQRDIYVDVVDQGALPHEALHVFLEAFATPRERALLQRYFEAPERARGRHWTEAAADAYRAWFDRVENVPEAIRRVFETVRAVLVRLELIIKGPSHRTVFEELSRGGPFSRGADLPSCHRV